MSWLLVRCRLSPLLGNLRGLPAKVAQPRAPNTAPTLPRYPRHPRHKHVGRFVSSTGACMARCVPPQRHSFFMQPEMPRAKHDGGRRIHTSDARRFCQCSPRHPVAPPVLSPVPFPPLRKLPANVVLLPELGNFRTRPRIFKWVFLLRLVTAATVEVPSQ